MGNLHAILLILLPVVTAAACVRFRKRSLPPQVAARNILAAAGRSPVTGQKLRTGKAILGEVLACTAFAFIVEAITQDVSLAGQAVMQLLIPWACLVAVAVFVADARIRFWLDTALAALLLGLPLSYVRIVQGPTYVGNPAYGRIRQARIRNQLGAISAALLKLAESDGASYPEGWLSEARFFGRLQPRLGNPSPEEWRLHVLPLWHTWLTGLYRRRYIELGVWYPGGPLKDAAGTLEYRERGPTAGHKAGSTGEKPAPGDGWKGYGSGSRGRPTRQRYFRDIGSPSQYKG